MNTKRVNKSGGISIPVGLRRELAIQPGDALDVETDAQGNVILKRHLPRCVFCGSTEEVTLWMGKGICRTCAGQIGKEEA